MQRGFMAQATAHIAVGGLFFGVLVGLMYFSERQVWAELANLKKTEPQKED